MATETQFAGTVAVVTTSPFSTDENWSDPTNLQGDTTGTAATCNVMGPGSRTARGLKCTNFGFSAVSGTIDDIQVELELSSTDDDTVIEHARIVKGDAIGSDATHDTGTWVQAKAYATAMTGLWGETWADTDITAADFGVAFNATGSMGGGETWSAHRVKITITYTEAAGGGTPKMTTLGAG